MLDILFLTWNRKGFTEQAFKCLLENTDWAQVDRLYVLDNNSTDGTYKWLAESVNRVPVTTVLRSVQFDSPVASMNDYIGNGSAEWFVKLDNDTCVPPGYLDHLLAVRDSTPGIDLLGMEAGMTVVSGRDPGYGDPDFDGIYRFEPSSHIGGIGLMRRAAFTGARMLPQARGRFGFTEWQHEIKPTRGWITPDLPVVLLDRLPFDPWLALSASYVNHGWQRDWPKWSAGWMRWAWEWMT